MNRIIAALLLLFWTASVGRCLAEQYGFLHELPGLECCEHEHAGDLDHRAPAPTHAPADNPCGICHMIENCGVQLVSPVIIASAHFLPVAELPLPKLDQMPVAITAAVQDPLWEPPVRLQWGAYLVNTCLPVRGPNLA